MLSPVLSSPVNVTKEVKRTKNPPNPERGRGEEVTVLTG